MIFRWYGYFSGKSTSHCTANLSSKELHKQALRGEVELLMVSCQCIIVIVMGTLVCWYCTLQTMNTNLTLFVLFIHSFLLQPKAWPKYWCWYVCIFAMIHRRICCSAIPSPRYLISFWMLPTTRTFDECFCPVQWGVPVHVIRLMECGGSIGASELLLEQQYNRGMEVGAA